MDSILCWVEMEKVAFEEGEIKITPSQKRCFSQNTKSPLHVFHEGGFCCFFLFLTGHQNPKVIADFRTMVVVEYDLVMGYW